MPSRLKSASPRSPRQGTHGRAAAFDRDHALAGTKAEPMQNRATQSAPRAGLLKRLAAGASARLDLISTALSNGGMQLSGVVTGVILARSLGVEGRGQLAMAMLWPIILAAAGSLGIPQAVVYFSARHRCPIGLMLWQCYLLAMLQAVILMGAGHFLVPVLLRGQTAVLCSAAKLFLWLIPLNLVTQPGISALQGQLRMKQFNWMRLSGNGIYVVGLVGLYACGALTVYSALMVLLVTNVATAALSVTYVSLVFGCEMRVDRGLMKELLYYGLRIHAGTVSPLLNQRLDQMLISLFLSPSQLGLYAAAATVSAAAEPMASAFSLMAFPRAARGNPGVRAFDRASSLGFLSIVAGGSCLFFVAPAAIHLCFGRDFAAAAPVCRILVIASILRTCRGLAGAVLSGLNRPGVSSKAEVFSLVLSLGLFFALLPSCGIVGAAIASALANAGAVIYVWRFAGCGPRVSSEEVNALT